MGAHEIKDIVAWNRQNVSNYAEAVAQRCSVKKVFFKNFPKVPGKHLCQGLFFIK